MGTVEEREYHKTKKILTRGQTALRSSFLKNLQAEIKLTLQNMTNDVEAGVVSLP